MFSCLILGECILIHLTVLATETKTVSPVPDIFFNTLKINIVISPVFVNKLAFYFRIILNISSSCLILVDKIYSLKFSDAPEKY